jgi:hypothetical protein
MIDPPAFHVLTSEIIPTIAGTAYSTNTSLWNTYVGFTVFSSFYQYFRPMKYRIMAVGAILSPPNVEPISFAFFPINYIVENVPTITALTAGGMSEFSGAVNYQTGYKNVG